MTTLNPESDAAPAHLPALILMLKAPRRSKRRLAAELGARVATEAAQQLTACALEDLAAWRGRIWAAPADAECEAWLAGTAGPLPLVPQGEGNLGERIERINRALSARRVERQIFIGIDCPELDRHYLERAAEALGEHDIVLGPARDGGVVLMAVRGLFPPLAALPWSTAALGNALAEASRVAGLSVATLEPRTDIDIFGDLAGLSVRLADDERPARRALRRWLAGIAAESNLEAR